MYILGLVLGSLLSMLNYACVLGNCQLQTTNVFTGQNYA